MLGDGLIWPACAMRWAGPAGVFSLDQHRAARQQCTAILLIALLLGAALPAVLTARISSSLHSSRQQLRSIAAEDAAADVDATDVAKSDVAYATLLYGDSFLLAVRVLGQSLRESGTTKCVCMAWDCSPGMMCAFVP